MARKVSSKEIFVISVSRKISILFVVSFLATFPAVGSCSQVFFDDFEDGLSHYVGKDGGAHSGIITGNPLGSGNVLAFAALGVGGDAFTQKTFAGGTYTLEFDYLGICGTDNCGGFIGYSYDLHPDLDILVYPDGDAEWVGGTMSPYPDLLSDTGNWVHVVIQFTTTQDADFHLMLEDFVSASPNAQDALFDNVRLSNAEVPLPGTLGLLTVGIAALGVIRNHRRAEK